MSLLQDYSVLFQQFSEQHDDWDILSQDPLSISREEKDGSLPLSISVYGNETKAHIYFNLYHSETFKQLAQKLLKINQKQEIQKADEDSGLVIAIDSDGIAVIFDASGITPNEFKDSLGSLIEKAEAVLVQVVTSAHKIIQKASEEVATDAAPSVAVAANLPIDEIVKQYFASEDFKYRNDEDNKRFIFGFSTDKYLNIKEEPSLSIVINYADSDLLRFETPWLYQFDLQKTDYSLIASAVAWFQFEYKFLSMSLDPTDGELKISIDIPIGAGTIHPSQIKRIVSFILQFTENTYEEYFALLLKDSQAAREKLNVLIDAYKEKVSNRRWFEGIKNKLDELTDEQKKAIEDILGQTADDKAVHGGI
ncbi:MULTISPECIES: hypothetical protein [unclassified Arsukibacterium]|uniref:hypothetical protein n=1 Tax=unclassified Arsukibacterium TaxID=2635278 RepID=UPI000C3BA7F2|nr:MULTISPECIES: hypothetical protein [unclassified Arsukibacterium]MAA96174.1 hypothetical protein [Rheinheimera sp.]MBM35368.1 hypothetical protein [Rheinheimera sp.]HAW91926.1 hypothetical protein [Candidatus Azambacteria bacterium]|tara:strand:+ start:7430 stop:8524 length:1095 start_codon:yes stop_codon:yes gene_type:complete